jgi:hypothetical protein
MPLDDLAEGFFRGLFRFLVSIFVEVVIEILIKGPGYFIVKACSSNSPDSDSLRVVFVGILFWVLIAIGGFSLYHQLTSQV